MTLTVRHRVLRRGICELARDLFGVALLTGTADAICQRASEASAGPHLHLGDWVLEQAAVGVDETGWRTGGEGRALWTTTTPEATFLEIAERCNREQFNALIGDYAGVVISDRWNGYNHLDPTRRQVCWSHLQRDFCPHADGLGEQKTFGENCLPLADQLFKAWRAYQHEHHDRVHLQAEIKPIQTQLRVLLEQASPKKAPQPLAPPVRQQPAQDLARTVDLHPPRRGRADQQLRRTRAPRAGHPPQTLARHSIR